MSFLPLFLFRIPHRKLYFCKSNVRTTERCDLGKSRVLSQEQAPHCLPQQSTERTQPPAPHDGGPTDDLQCWELAPLVEGPSFGGRLSPRATGRIRQHMHAIPLVLGTAPDALEPRLQASLFWGDAVPRGMQDLSSPTGN